MTPQTSESAGAAEVWTFGWQGLTVQVPESWDLSAYDGARESGSLSLADGLRVRLRMRWSAAGKSDDPAEDAYRLYERRLQKSAGAGIAPVRPDAARAGVSAQGANQVIPFEWAVGQGVVYGAVVYDPDAARLVAAEVCGPREMGRRNARRVLSSIAFSADDADALWSVYGFAFRSPPLYNLESARLESGRLRFLFVRDASSWLRIERWSLAAHLLRRVPLDQWPAEYLKLTKLRCRELDTGEPTTWGIHPSRRFTAELPPSGLRRRARGIRGRVWHDDAADRITVVAALGMEPESLDAVAATVAHRATP